MCSSDLPNVGLVLEDLLKRAGMESPEALRAIGSREAWLRIRGIDPSACLHMLQALKSAIRGVGKKDLPEAVKAGLWEFFEERRKGGEEQRSGESFIIALAIEILCFCPPERLAPPSPNMVS